MEGLFVKTPLVNYLVRLETNRGEALAFKKDPRAAMKAAGLSREHQDVLQGRNPARIRDAVAAEQPFAPVLCPIIRPF
jgi:hypothetical protein